jgi:hypothetical protein
LLSAPSQGKQAASQPKTIFHGDSEMARNKDNKIFRNEQDPSNDNDIIWEDEQVTSAAQSATDYKAPDSDFSSKVKEALDRAYAARNFKVITARDSNNILPGDSSFDKIDKKPFKPYGLWDASQLKDWECPSIQWLIQDLIQLSSITFISGAPKDYKSFLALYICLLLSQPQSGQKFLDRFACESAKILYLSSEDSVGRVKERVLEICETHKLSLPNPEILQFRIRKPFQLKDDSQILVLTNLIQTYGFNMIVFDTLSRSMVGVEENSSKDIGEITSILENIRDETGVTILCIDHTRKPQGLNQGRNDQNPNPFNLRGSSAKYAMAESMISLARTKQPGQLQIATENKDTDKRFRFLVDVSEKGSPEAKFKYGGEIESASSKTAKASDVNRSMILAAIGDDWITRREIEGKTQLKKSTVQDYLAALVKENHINRKNKGQTAYYRKSDQGTNTVNPVGKS